MAKKLTAKTQQLNPKLSQFSNSFSQCIFIEPETQEILLKKGTVYAVFEITGDSNFNTEFVDKVITDVLRDSYYQSENISPVQSMEKAISEIKERVLQLSSDALISNTGNIVLNFVSAVLWGNVLYVVKYGEIEAYTIIEGEATPLKTISEGNFSSFSKLVDEDDIFIFCTKSFFEEFPPERLLNASISEGNLNPNQSCLLMKLIMDTKIPQNEEIDLGLGNALAKSQQRETTDKILKVLKNIQAFITSGAKKIGDFLKPLWEKINKATGKIFKKRKAVLFTRKITQIGEEKNKKTKGWLFLSLITILLAISIFYTLKPTIFKEKKENEEEEKTEENTGIPEEQQIITEDRSKDEEYKIQRVNPEVFYDVKITDLDANPSELQIVGDKLVTADKNSGKIYYSTVDTPNFSTDKNSFIGIRSLAESDNLLSFLDNEGYKTYNIENSQVEDSFEMSSVTTAYPYYGYIYTISGDILTRNSIKEDGSLDGILWGQNQDFRNAKSMAIAYDIYIIKENGELVSYSNGLKTDFKVSGLEEPFKNPVKVVTNIDFSNIYVADAGKNRIVVINKEGELVKQFKNNDDSLWRDIRSISVTADEKNIFVLDSNKIYKLNIE